MTGPADTVVIVEREAHKKWIDRSGTPYHPLISLDEHHELLSMIAREMWITNTDVLRNDVLEVVVDLFVDARAKSPLIARQIKERLPQHSLLTTVDNRHTQFSFDHEDFRQFYLGDAVGQALLAPSDNDLRELLRAGTLPAGTCDAAAQYVRRHAKTIDEINRIANRLVKIGGADTPTSLTRENCGAIWIRLVDNADHKGLTASELVFPVDALHDRKLINVFFIDCYFQSTSIGAASIKSAVFTRCRMDRIELSGPPGTTTM